MKDFLYDLLIEPFIDSWSNWIDYLLCILMWFIVLFILGLSFFGIYYITDSCFLKEEESVCVYESKYINEAHNTTAYVMSGKVMIPVTTYHPREYRVVFKLKKLKDSYTVSEYNYNLIKDNDSFYCKYSIGRISKELYIKHVFFNRRGIN